MSKPSQNSSLENSSPKNTSLKNSSGVIATARLIATKDLRVELRSRVLLNQVVPFSLIVMVMFAFALDSDAVLERVAPGLVW